MMTLALALLLVQDLTAPGTLSLKAGETAEYEQTTTIDLEVSAAFKGKEEKATQTLTMALGYRLEVVEAGEPAKVRMTIASAKFDLKQGGFKAQESSWTMEKGPVELNLLCGPDGRLRRDPGCNPRAAFKLAGAEGRMAKIPGVYLFAGLPGATPDGPMIPGGLLPGKAAASWSATIPQLIGPGSLLDDFSQFEEKWSFKASKREGDAVTVAATCDEVVFTKGFEVAEFKIAKSGGKGEIVLDAKSGWVTTASLTREFEYSAAIEKTPAQGKIRRTDTVKRKAAAAAK